MPKPLAPPPIGEKRLATCLYGDCQNEVTSRLAKYCPTCRTLIKKELGLRVGISKTRTPKAPKPTPIYISGSFYAAFENDILQGFIKRVEGREHKHRLEFIDRHLKMGREIRTLTRRQLDIAMVEREQLGKLLKK